MVFSKAQSARPYFDKSGNPCLEQSVIVVSDILGFKNLTSEAFKEGQGQNLLRRLHTTIHQASLYLKDKSEAKWFTKFYSDNLIVGFPHLGTSTGQFEFAQACHCIGHFQREMAIEGFFLRGGIAVDAIHISDNLAFGKVFEELVEAEKSGKLPKVILLESATDYLNAHPGAEMDQSLNGILLEDGKRSYVNYLYAFSGHIDKERVAGMHNHKRHIENGLEKYKNISGQKDILKKYKWLADYHNRFCVSSGIYDTTEFIISR